MYYFGSVEDTAKLAMNELSELAGPGVVTEGSLETWTPEEIRTNMIYASSALRRAANKGADVKFLAALSKQYEELLFAYTHYDDVIYRAMEAGEHRFPWMDHGAMARQQIGVRRIVEGQTADRAGKTDE